MRLQKLTSRILGGYGYRVLQASNGDEALNIRRKHDGPIHLVLTDVIMPGMNGPELAKTLRDQRPDLRVLYMSGYAAEELDLEAELNERAVFVAKPCLPSKMFQILSDLVKA